MIVRMFSSALDPDDVARAKRLFAETVRPTFQQFGGCIGIEMYVGLEEHSADLIDVATLSRWESRDAMEQASSSSEYDRSLAEIKTLFQQSPIIRHFETVE
jgi:quinol monooxygenase YgiN